jgi:hypothetical protein
MWIMLTKDHKLVEFGNFETIKEVFLLIFPLMCDACTEKSYYFPCRWQRSNDC